MVNTLYCVSLTEKTPNDEVFFLLPSFNTSWWVMLIPPINNEACPFLPPENMKLYSGCS